jgi:hypothetical protein
MTDLDADVLEAADGGRIAVDPLISLLNHYRDGSRSFGQGR